MSFGSGERMTNFCAPPRAEEIGHYPVRLPTAQFAGARLADRGRYRGLQRGYFTHAEQSCASAGTIALTVVAGPLNYVGVNPKVTDCNVPQPS
jgi:hypothetical protein